MKQITLKEARTNMGLTIEEVSEKTGIDKDLLIELEKDSSEIEFNTLIELVKLYQISSDDLFLGNTDYKSEPKSLDDFTFNIYRMKQLLRTMQDYIDDIQDASLNVNKAIDQGNRLNNLLALAHTVNREIYKLEALTSLVADELELLQ